MSDAHKTWLYERLVTIVPNNRRILNLVIEGGELFSQDEQQILSKFEIHARGYERWVGQEISYEGVAFFPVEFDELIQGLATNGRL